LGGENGEKKMINREKLIDIKELSKYLNINDRTIYSWVQKEMIPHYRIGGSRGMVRFDYPTIDKWIESKKNGYTEEV
tara:strand:+ start:169 stop:399 length:231 start_codon:yes stop_codon:yes gene_type:complete